MLVADLPVGAEGIVQAIGMPIRAETVVLLQSDQSIVFFIEAVLCGSRYCRVMPFPEVNLSEHVDRPIAIVGLEGGVWVALPVA